MNHARPAADPDAIILEACPPELATISLAGIVNCDPLTRPIVDALAAGHELPEEFLILDTYADCGWPPAVANIRRIRREVRETLAALDLPATLADRLPPSSLVESLVAADVI